jgi:hypothetical protein
LQALPYLFSNADNGRFVELSSAVGETS